MTTLTLKINEKSKAGIALMSFLEIILKQSGVEVIAEKSPYNPEFVKMVKDAAKSKNRTRIAPDNVWESI